MTQNQSSGRLVLVPNALDLGTDPVPLRDVLSDAALRRAASLPAWVVENAKTARAFLKRVNEIHPLTLPLQALAMVELPRPRKGDPAASIPGTAWRELLAPALAAAQARVAELEAATAAKGTARAKAKAADA